MQSKKAKTPSLDYEPQEFPRFPTTIEETALIRKVAVQKAERTKKTVPAPPGECKNQRKAPSPSSARSAEKCKVKKASRDRGQVQECTHIAAVSRAWDSPVHLGVSKTIARGCMVYTVQCDAGVQIQQSDYYDSPREVCEAASSPVTLSWLPSHLWSTRYTLHIAHYKPSNGNDSSGGVFISKAAAAAYLICYNAPYSTVDDVHRKPLLLKLTATGESTMCVVSSGLPNVARCA